MKRIVAAAALLALAACGKDEAPPPAPVTPTPQVIPDAKPEAKAPEAPKAEVPKADPNKELASRVKRALEDVKLVGIDASAADGKVTLWGTTSTDDDRKRAASIAAKVDGVKSVDNQLKVVKGS